MLLAGIISDSAHGGLNLNASKSISIGRDSGNDLVLADELVSRYHAKIEMIADQVYLTDLNSTNGVSIEGQQIIGSVELHPSQWIKLGNSKLYFDGINLFDPQGVVVASLKQDEIHTDDALPLAKALMSPLDAQSWKNWLLLSLLFIIPIISFFAEGYRIRLLQNGMRGRMAMPALVDWRDLFINGLYFFLVRALYLIIPAILSLAVLLIYIGMPGRSVGFERASAIILTLIYMAVWFLIPMAWAHFAATGSLREAIRIKSILQSIQVVLPQYLQVWLIYTALVIFLAIMALLPIIGVIIFLFGAFYLYIISALLFGAVYRRSLS